MTHDRQVHAPEPGRVVVPLGLERRLELLHAPPWGLLCVALFERGELVDVWSPFDGDGSADGPEA